jgi:hypothetical protein
MKTLRFLNSVADSASALVTDIKILEAAAVKSGILGAGESTDMNSSFSSHSEPTPQAQYV